MISPHIVNDQIDFNTIKELWDVLDCAYDDPDRQGTAKREPAMPKQGTREFSAYFADFQRIMAELKWDPSAKKAALRQGMAGNFKDLLLSYDCLDDCVTACLRYLAVSLDTFPDNHNDQPRHVRKCAHVYTAPAANPQRLVIRIFYLFLLLSAVS